MNVICIMVSCHHRNANYQNAWKSSYHLCSIFHLGNISLGVCEEKDEHIYNFLSLFYFYLIKPGDTFWLNNAGFASGSILLFP